MLNRVILIGRLTRDPELKYTTNGIAVANFTLAVDRYKKADDEKQADFIPIVVWQKQAESCAEYLGKGSLCAVDGRLQVRTYDDKNGNKRWVTEVIADAVRFLDRRNKSENSDGLTNAYPPGYDIEFGPDDIPF